MSAKVVFKFSDGNEIEGRPENVPGVGDDVELIFSNAIVWTGTVTKRTSRLVYKIEYSPDDDNLGRWEEADQRIVLDIDGGKGKR